MIKFENVSVQYVEEFVTLFDFSHTFNKNSLLIGDKLSGSNTILRLIAKLDKNYNGKIRVNNTNLKQIADKNLNLAFVSEQPYLFKFKSLENNLAYGLKLRKFDKQTIKSMIDEFVERFNLNTLPKKMRKLNLSQQKILSLARAVIRKPKILLLEYFFEDLDSSLYPVANEMLKTLNEDCLIIACENKKFDFFSSFETLNFSFGSLV